MKKHFNEDLKTEIIKRKLNGESAHKLALEYNMGTSTIYKWLRLQNVVESKTTSLIDVKSLIDTDIISLNINGLDIKIDTINLNKLLNGLS